MRLHWTDPVPEGAVLKYLRGGEFSAQLTAADFDREFWADLFVKHAPAWHDGTALGHPGIPIRPQPPAALMTLEAGRSTVPGDGGAYARPASPMSRPDRPTGRRCWASWRTRPWTSGGASRSS